MLDVILVHQFIHVLTFEMFSGSSSEWGESCLFGNIGYGGKFKKYNTISSLIELMYLFNKSIKDLYSMC